MKKQIKFASVFAALAVIALVFAGCKNNNDSDPISPPAPTYTLVLANIDKDGSNKTLEKVSTWKIENPENFEKTENGKNYSYEFSDWTDSSENHTLSLNSSEEGSEIRIVSDATFTANWNVYQKDSSSGATAYYSADGKTLIKVTALPADGAFTVREGTETIGSVDYDAKASSCVFYYYEDDFDKAVNLTGQLTSVVIPTTVKEIGQSAFRNCTALTSVTFTETSSLEKICKSAFYNCTGITTITIPDSVKTVEAGAFAYWKNTQTIKVPFAENANTGWSDKWYASSDNIETKATIEYTPAS